METIKREDIIITKAANNWGAVVIMETEKYIGEALNVS